MGIVHKPTLPMYWSKEPIFATPITSRLMRRDRFEQIRKMVHFTDPLSEDPLNSLRKLDTFLNSLREKFRANYTPTKFVAVDEYLSLWKGRLSFKIYIPNKRERYGVKIYMLCESSTGYLPNFIVYWGADTDYPEPAVVLPKPFKDYKNPSKVVLSLMVDLYGKGYNLALDNLYTSPDLLKALFQNSFDAYGTLRKKEGLPKDFWSWKPVKGVGEPAMTKWCDKTYVVLRWNDPYKTKSQKVVSLMSTKHTGEIAETGRIHHATQRPILKPDVIVCYNKTMGGVDNLSRVLVPYSLARKGVKWYRKLAELFVDFTVYNSFVIRKKLNRNNKSHYQFRLQLMNIITMFHVDSDGAKCPGNSGQPSALDNPLCLKGKHFIRMIPVQPPNNKRKRKNCVRRTAMKKKTRHNFFECSYLPRRVVFEIMSRNLPYQETLSSRY